VVLAQVPDQPRRGNDPAGPQPGQCESLRKAAGNDNLVVPACKGRRQRTADFGASIDFIGQDPGADAIGGRDNGVHFRFCQDGSRRVVRIRNDDDFGPASDGLFQAVDVETPFHRAIVRALHDQSEGLHALPVCVTKSHALQVVRNHERDTVFSAYQAPQGRVVGLGTTVGHRDAVTAREAVECGDVVPQAFAAGGVRVA
jgi:hypothetical protein